MQGSGSPPARPCLHLFCGKAGSGKSTLARRVAAAEDAFLISEDVWLARLYGEQMQSFDDYRRCALRLRSVVEPLTLDLLRAGRDVVLDFPANTKASRAWFRGLIVQSGGAHILHFVDCPDAVCLQRIAQRNLERPEGSHPLTPEQFASISSLFEPPGPEEGFDLKAYGR